MNGFGNPRFAILQKLKATTLHMHVSVAKIHLPQRTFDLKFDRNSKVKADFSASTFGDPQLQIGA